MPGVGKMGCAARVSTWVSTWAWWQCAGHGDPDNEGDGLMADQPDDSDSAPERWAPVPDVSPLLLADHVAGVCRLYRAIAVASGRVDGASGPRGVDLLRCRNNRCVGPGRTSQVSFSADLVLKPFVGVQSFNNSNEGGILQKKHASPRPRRRPVFAGVCAVLTLTMSVLAIATPPADAYSLIGKGCRYDPRNSPDGLGIGIDSSVTKSESDATKQAGVKYWSAAIGPNFTYIGTSLGASKVDLRVSSANLGATVQGVTYYSCGSDHFTQDPVFKWSHNQTSYTWTQARREAVATHEIGHSLGVGHNNNSRCSGVQAGLMYSDAIGKQIACGWVKPTTDDKNGATRANNGK